MINNDNRNNFLAILSPDNGLVQISKLEFAIRAFLVTPVSSKRVKAYCAKHSVTVTEIGNGPLRKSHVVPVDRCVEIAHAILAENKLAEEAKAKALEAAILKANEKAGEKAKAEAEKAKASSATPALADLTARVAELENACHRLCHATSTHAHYLTNLAQVLDYVTKELGISPEAVLDAAAAAKAKEPKAAH